MRDTKRNPFQKKDVDRFEIWEMLVFRDSNAYVNLDWDMVKEDFVPEIFEGITSNNSLDPSHWTITYPNLESYRNDWINGAIKFIAMPLVGITPRELLFKCTYLKQIEIKGDRGVAHKQFIGREKLSDGSEFKISCQTLYRLHRINQNWKIVGFIGYLPLNDSAVSEN